jgi:hypothetical protein
MNIRQTCVLRFRTTAGKQRQLSLSNPRSNINRSAVESVANTLINADIFTEKAGKLASLTGAEFVTVTTNKVI